MTATTAPTEPKFRSPLASDIKEFLSFKRALGRIYERHALALLSFDRWVAAHRELARRGQIDGLISSWLARGDGRKPTTVAFELSVVRQFCLFQRRQDPDYFVPDRTIVPTTARGRFLPYIFSPREVRFLVEQTKTLPGPRLRALTFRTLILVLYCTGLRFGEAVRLTRDDLDLGARAFLVRSRKSQARWVPFRTDLARVITSYLRGRDLIGPTHPGSPLFVQVDGHGYTAKTASRALCRFLRRLGLKPPSGRQGPRPYDLRATFAVHRLTRWHRAEADLEAKLPLLSAYMGHKSILGTECYLPATVDLLRLASGRLARRLARHDGR